MVTINQATFIRYNITFMQKRIANFINILTKIRFNFCILPYYWYSECVIHDELCVILSQKSYYFFLRL